MPIFKGVYLVNRNLEIIWWNKQYVFWLQVSVDKAQFMHNYKKPTINEILTTIYYINNVMKMQ